MLLHRTVWLLVEAGLFAFALAAGTADPVPSLGASAAQPTGKLKHLIVIYMENWPFDALYGTR